MSGDINFYKIAWGVLCFVVSIIFMVGARSGIRRYYDVTTTQTKALLIVAWTLSFAVAIVFISMLFMPYLEIQDAGDVVWGDEKRANDLSQTIDYLMLLPVGCLFLYCGHRALEEKDREKAVVKWVLKTFLPGVVLIGLAAEITKELLIRFAV